MMDFLRTFFDDEDGAVTVDWVVLTAAIVGLGILVLGSVREGATNLSDDIEKSLEDTNVDSPTSTTPTDSTSDPDE
ncbi:hypothetical protein [Rubellimicrobium aerolatum]|uniref:Pilus assembly protein n=1 Tax=Rubellimicrobium aerolatum TaxID=490979 RepID=A0ABW0SFE4_9RHOB|nr:hypothetical protein [Rubellimicrobium aerolatum]MBP1807143.1 Flp pilus assembly pilin Flp [Rubellimicrobium aerolatum]